MIPEYDNKFNVASWQGWLSFDAIALADELAAPVLLVHSDAAAIPQGARKFSQKMGDKSTDVWLDNVTQFDFYDKPANVNRAIDEVDKHFKQTLK